jgi:glycosyltransferase involved in cell wall biosynthesis
LDEWRLIVCDDCGPDPASRELVAQFKDPRISYFRGEHNLGIAGNWNRCLDLAGSGLCSLLHADDELLPHYGRVMVAAGQHYPDAAAFFCRARIIGPDSREKFSFPDYYKRFLAPGGGIEQLSGEAAVKALLKGNFIMCPTLCYRLERVGERRFLNEWRQVLDLEFTTRLLLGNETIVSIPELAYSYRRHENNTTARYTASLHRFDEEVRLYNLLGQKTAQIGWDRARREADRKTIIKLNLIYCGLGDFISFRWRAARRKIAYFLRMMM